MMDLETLRAAWANDIAAMRAGTYVPPMVPAHKVIAATRHTKGQPPARVPTLEEVRRKERVLAAYLRGDKMELIAHENGVSRSYINKVARVAGLPRRKAKK